MAIFCSFQEAQFCFSIFQDIFSAEPWKLFLVLYPIARDEVAGFDGHQFRFNFASGLHIGASGVEAATARDIYR